MFRSNLPSISLPCYPRTSYPGQYRQELPTLSRNKDTHAFPLPYSVLLCFAKPYNSGVGEHPRVLPHTFNCSVFQSKTINRELTCISTEDWHLRKRYYGGKGSCRFRSNCCSSKPTASKIRWISSGIWLTCHRDLDIPDSVFLTMRTDLTCLSARRDVI